MAASVYTSGMDGGCVMGKIMDRAVFSALAATGLYLFFLNAWGSVGLAGALAFAGVAVGSRLVGRRPRRASLGRVRAELLRLAGLSDAQATAELTALVRWRWPGEAFALAPVLKHPEATLTSGDLLSAWKANREAARLVVAATCPAEPRALAYARQLEGPAMAVVDSRALSRILRRTLPPDDKPRRIRWPLWRVGMAFLPRGQRVSPKNAMLAAALLMLYARGASPLYLFAALALIAHLGVALGQRRVGKRLFD